MNACVVIPAYNEAPTIGKIISELKKQKLQVFVIDDGSTDDTAHIASAGGAFVLSNPKNRGKGYCLIKVFNHVFAAGFDAAVVMDGDGQHSPEDIKYFLEAAENSAHVIFIGNRMNDTKNMPYIRLLTNKVMSSVISAIIKQKVPDSQCGFRLIKKELFEKVNFSMRNYEIESEMIIKASRLGYKVSSIGISTIYNGSKSAINPFVDAIRFISYIAGEMISKG